jgi:hypothetical protein
VAVLLPYYGLDRFGEYRRVRVEQEVHEKMEKFCPVSPDSREDKPERLPWGSAWWVIGGICLLLWASIFVLLRTLW